MKQLGDDPSPFAAYMRHCFGPFEFDDVKHTPPTRTFDRELGLDVGDKHVELIEVGPAHTRGDVLVHVPDDRVVYTGAILFVEGTPIMWAGPVARWIDACRRIESMDVDIVVPGHGPITDRRGAAAVRHYLEHIRDEARKRYDAGMSAAEAARDIDLRDFENWSDAERIVVNVDRLYAEFAGSEPSSDIATLFGQMAAIAGFSG